MKVWHKGVGIGGLAIIGALIWLACSGGGQEARVPGPVTAPCQALEEFERFRYRATYKIESPKPEGSVDETELGEPPFAILPTAESFAIAQEYDGSFVAPDRFLVEVSTPSEEDTQGVLLTFIGDQAWAKPEIEGATWVSAAVDNGLPPLEVCDAVLGKLDLTGLPSVPDTLNGLKTQHFQIEQADLEVAATLFGPESDMGRLTKLYDLDMWVTEEGWPAKLEASSDGTYPSGRQLFMEVTLEIRDVDAGDIEIEPPV